MSEEQFRQYIAVMRQIAFVLSAVPVMLFVLTFVVALK